MARNDDVKSFLITLANYQENLLQGYRSIFVSSQTILISIAMLLLAIYAPSISSLLFYFLLSIIGFVLIGFWLGITESRELDVSYCHMQLKKLEKGDLNNNEIDFPWISFKEWQNKYKESGCPNNKKKEEINGYDKDFLASTTRKKMGLLPWIFLGIWIIGFLIFGYLYFILV